MAQSNNILQELEDLGCKTLIHSISTPYQVPGRYFDDLAAQILGRIKALEATNAGEELAYLSELVSRVPGISPYQVPTGYFDGLEKRLLQVVLDSEKELSPREELESISPLLSSLKKQVPYSVPVDYFKNLDLDKEKKQDTGAKVVLISSRKWIRYAAAAVVVGLITIAGLLYFKKDKLDPSDTSYAWVKKNMNKVSTDDLDKFIDLAEEEAPVIANNSIANEVKELMKNVPDQAIQDFLADATDAEPDSSDDILLN
jgi:hypothetical protein